MQELHILTEEEFPRQIGLISQKLEAVRREGYFTGVQGCRLHYAYFLAENSRGSVVIVHGLSEFIPKYYELIHYFLEQEYHVFIYEQRCHGLSDRLTDQPDVLHTDRFDDYAADLDLFIRQIVQPVDARPLNLFAHSMGGAVAVIYMATYRHTIRRAVLSSPLMQTVVGPVPHWVARTSVLIDNLRWGGKKKFRRSKDFIPDFPFEKANDISYARFFHNQQMRCNNPCYQTTPTSNSWVRGSLTLRNRLPRLGKKIRTPILLLSAENDTTVVNEAQYRFAKKCPACRLEVMKGSKHSMMTGDYQTITDFMTRMLTFFEE